MSRLIRAAVGTTLVLVVLGGAEALAGLGSIDLAPKHDFPAGIRPFGLIKADLNRDRKLDLATAGGDGVNILLGRGDGSFRAPRTIPTPGGLSDLRLTDLNRDRPQGLRRRRLLQQRDRRPAAKAGRRLPDAGFLPDPGLPLQPGDRRLQPRRAQGRRRGRGGGPASSRSCSVAAAVASAPGPTTRVGDSPYFIAVADYDRDGRKDLAVTVFSDDTVVVLYGRRNGTFGGRRSFPAGDGPYPILARDLNRDRRVDLLVGNYQSGKVVLLKGKRGGFGAPRTVLTQPALYFLNLTDVNRDGRRDLLSVNIENLDGSDGLAVQRGLGGSQFSPTPVYFATGPRRSRSPPASSTGTASPTSPYPTRRSAPTRSPSSATATEAAQSRTRFSASIPRVTPRKSIVSCDEAHDTARSRSPDGR